MKHNTRKESCNLKEQLDALLSKEVLLVWNGLTDSIESLYDVDRLWDKGFGNWKIEYKYRRGGKPFVPFMLRKMLQIF